MTTSIRIVMEKISKSLRVGGYHSCGIDENGQVVCFGADDDSIDYGQVLLETVNYKSGCWLVLIVRLTLKVGRNAVLDRRLARGRITGNLWQAYLVKRKR